MKNMYKACTIICSIMLMAGCLYQAGTGVGNVGDLRAGRYKLSYVQKYADTFFVLYPKYKLPDSIQGSGYASNYGFLNMTEFYFDTSPKEVYHVDWGTTSVRFAYNIEERKEIYCNHRGNIDISEIERERITARMHNEVILRIDSIINSSIDRDSALLSSTQR
jgi:hypothetical protein